MVGLQCATGGRRRLWGCHGGARGPPFVWRKSAPRRQGSCSGRTPMFPLGSSGKGIPRKGVVGLRRSGQSHVGAGGELRRRNISLERNPDCLLRTRRRTAEPHHRRHRRRGGGGPSQRPPGHVQKAAARAAQVAEGPGAGLPRDGLGQ